ATSHALAISSLPREMDASTARRPRITTGEPPAARGGGAGSSGPDDPEYRNLDGNRPAACRDSRRGPPRGANHLSRGRPVEPRGHVRCRRRYGMGSGIWKTTNWLDPDPTWVPVVPPELAQDVFIHGLAMAPSDPNILYAASAGPEGGILKTTDGGANWQLLGGALFAPSPFGAIAVRPVLPGVILLRRFPPPHP